MAVPAARRVKRRPRDWVVDSLLFAVAVVFGLLTAGGRLEASTPVLPAWLLGADAVAGAIGCAGLWLRRRWPVGLALVLIALSTFSEFVAGALIVGTLTVAIHRPPRTTAAVFALSVLAGLVYTILRPDPGLPAWFVFLIGLVVQGAAVGWGLFIRYRRQLVLSLRDRAERAETEAQLRAEQAQQRTRDEIAREMHDVLGHRLSLLSVHAGALEFRPDAPADEVGRAAKVIRENAHQALQDLREVIGVLRAPVGELPQPTLADVRQLVDESGRAGMRVALHDETSGPVGDLTGRTAYRVVQEALTNARKHAPGAEVHVHLSGSPGTGLAVEVHNTAPPPALDPPAVDPAPVDPPGPVHPPAVGPSAVDDPAAVDPTAVDPAAVDPAAVDPAAVDPTAALPPDLVRPLAVDSPGPAPGPPVGERSRSADGDAARYPQPRSGQGLAGLAERVGLASGRLEHGPASDGGWCLSAWLPWPP
jgi:signal transduction histidine kinase